MYEMWLLAYHTDFLKIQVRWKKIQSTESKGKIFVTFGVIEMCDFHKLAAVPSSV